MGSGYTILLALTSTVRSVETRRSLVSLFGGAPSWRVEVSMQVVEPVQSVVLLQAEVGGASTACTDHRHPRHTGSKLKQPGRHAVDVAIQGVQGHRCEGACPTTRSPCRLAGHQLEREPPRA
jgi:hypothetical protein